MEGVKGLPPTCTREAGGGREGIDFVFPQDGGSVQNSGPAGARKENPLPAPALISPEVTLTRFPRT